MTFLSRLSVTVDSLLTLYRKVTSESDCEDLQTDLKVPMTGVTPGLLL